MTKLLYLALVIIFSSLFFLPGFSFACNEGDEHSGEMESLVTGMTIAEGEEMEESISLGQISSSQAKEIIWWINSLLLSLLMLAGIYWLVKNTGNK